MDAQLFDLLQQDGLSMARQNASLVASMSQNLTQGLGVIQSVLILLSGGTQDDPGLLAALNTADRVPVVKG